MTGAVVIIVFFQLALIEGQWRNHEASFLSSRPNVNASMIEIRRFSVPRFIPLEKDVRLECDYAVEGESALYSLKWYKGGSQFYEFIPSKIRKHTIFPAQGLRQDRVHAAVDGRVVTLKEVGTGATDQYRCELVAEGPPFHTTQQQDNLTVVVLPRGPPRLTGIKTSYHSHDYIELNCTPPLAKPAATIHWFINGQPGHPSYYRNLSHFVNPAGLESVTSRLQLEVRKAKFYKGKLNIKCKSTLAGLYEQSSHITIKEPSSSWFVSSNLYFTSGCDTLHSHKHFSGVMLMVLSPMIIHFFYNSRIGYNNMIPSPSSK